MTAIAVLSLGTPTVFPAGGAELFAEPFTGATVTSPNWIPGGTGGAFVGQWDAAQACLTAGDDIAGTPIPGCTNPALDAAGSGVLRLTPAANTRAGFALYDSPLPSAGGLDITFHQYQWGGTGADGISFFIVDGSAALSAPGASGGALGYGTNGVTPGVADGLVGIGLDAFGNFSSAASAGTGCAAGTGPGSAGPGALANRIAIRGPGNGTVGYCWLGASSVVGLRDTSRAASDATIRIVLDPATAATRNITVYRNGVQVVQVPAPPELLSAANFKFGFAASTGGSTDNHEIGGLTIAEAPPSPAAIVTPTVRFTG